MSSKTATEKRPVVPSWATKKFAKITKRMPDDIVTTKVNVTDDGECTVDIEGEGFHRVVVLWMEGERCKSKTSKRKA